MTITLSLYPNQRGLGYVCAKMPDKLLDYGILNVRLKTRDNVMGHVKRFATYFKPTIILVKDNERGSRIDQLSDEIEEYAKLAGIPVFRYTREQIKDVFEISGATTKLEITARIVEAFPQLKDRMPKIRKPWLPEAYNMGIFDALALAITHHYLTK